VPRPPLFFLASHPHLNMSTAIKMTMTTKAAIPIPTIVDVEMPEPLLDDWMVVEELSPVLVVTLAGVVA